MNKQTLNHKITALDPHLPNLPMHTLKKSSRKILSGTTFTRVWNIKV